MRYLAWFYLAYINFAYSSKCLLDQQDIKFYEHIQDFYLSEKSYNMHSGMYVKRLTFQKLKYKQFCHCKDDNKITSFCSEILIKYYSLKIKEQSYQNDLSANRQFKTKSLKKEQGIITNIKQRNPLEEFIIEITRKLQVQYMLIILDMSQMNNINRLLLRKSFKSISHLDIRLSVYIFDNQKKNISEALNVSKTRPCVVFVLGGLKNLVQEVINTILFKAYLSYLQGFSTERSFLYSLFLLDHTRNNKR